MPLNIFDGSSWNPLKKVQIHDGSTWNESKAAYIWDGSEWKSLLDLKPKNTELPILSLQGGAFWYAAQETVSVSNGVWENSPTSFKYQWQKAAWTGSSYNWSNITGKTSNTLQLDEDEWNSTRTLKYVGYVVRCKVTATNAAGDNDPDVYTLPSPLIGPQKLSVVSASVVSNGVIKVDWTKPIGANDFYIQYSGAASGEIQLTGDVNTYEIDTGNGSGGLLLLVRPLNTSNISGTTVQGIGANASVSDVKPNKPGVTTTMSSSSNGGTLSWSLNLIQPTEWIVYNNGNMESSSYFSGGPSQTSYWIERIGVGGTTYGSYTITVTGTAPRFTETSWSSFPGLPIVYPSVPLPVNQVAPTVSGTGRSFTSTNGTWSNSSSIYSYIHEWYADGVNIPFGIGSTLSLGDTTQYDNKSITSSVYVLTTDLNTTSKTYSSNSVASTTKEAEEPTSPVQYWACCGNGAGVTGTYANSSAALTGLNAACNADEPGINNQVAGGVSRTPVCVPTTYTIPNLVGTYNPSSTSSYNIAAGTAVGTTDYTKEGLVSSQSPAAGTIVNSSPIPTITVNKFTYQASPDFPPPQEKPACPGTITNAAAYTCAELGRQLLGNSTTYAISVGQQCCGDFISCPTPSAWSAWSTCSSEGTQTKTRTNYHAGSCTAYTETQTQECTPPVTVTYYIGYSLCNNNSGNYGSSPSVSGPYTASSIPTDVISGPSSAREVLRYRSTSSAALAAAAQAGCAPAVFAPPSFFAPPGFFSPPAFPDPDPEPVFTPPAFPEPDPDPVFAPPEFFAPPAFGAPGVFAV